MPKLHQKLYDQVFEAILSGRIEPGTRLAETELAEIYQVSRSVIRRTLQRMSDEGLVDIRQNLGARVNCVSHEDAGAIFEARRVIELGVVEIVCGHLGRETLGALRDICTEESTAMADHNRARGLRLSAEFHLTLAEATRNPVLISYAGNLMSRSALATACLERRDPGFCAFGEHEAIVDALAKGNLDLSRRLMARHIEHIASNLEHEPPSLGAVLSAG